MALTPIELLRNRRAAILTRVGGATGTFSPLSLGVKLRRWIHPNDPEVVTESSGDLSAIADKGKVGDNAVAIGTPTIAAGVVSFDGADQGLALSTLLDTFDNSEFYASLSIPDDGVFLITASDEGGTGNYVAFGLREQSDNVIHGEWNTNAAATLDQVWDELSVVSPDTQAIVGFRKNYAGDGFIISVNGVEASGDDLTAEAGTDSGDWTDEPTGIDNTQIGVLTTSGGSTFYEGALGKAGFIETAPLTASERENLILWMRRESGLTNQ